MRFAALFLVSALVVSASAFNVLDLVKGFASGLRFVDINNLEQCRADGLSIVTAAKDIPAEIRTIDPNVIADGIETLGHALGETVRVCAGLIVDAKTNTEEMIHDLSNLDQNTLLSHVMGNLAFISSDYTNLANGIKERDAFAVGLNTANLISIVLFGKQNAALKAQHETLDFGFSVDVVDDVVTLIDGFLKVAKTSISTNDVDVCLGKNLSTLINEAEALLKALESKNFASLIGLLVQIASDAQAIKTSCTTLVNDFVVEANTLIPLLEDSERVENAVLALLYNSKQTVAFAQAVAEAFKANDFAAAGGNLGNIYNIFYDGLAQ